MRRLDAIQAMRFLAAALVVVTHSTLYAHDRLSSRIGVWHFGEIGVPIFFTISGLVMVVSTAGHHSERGYWRVFALRRLIRIAPMYWLATTVKLLTLILLPSAVLYASFNAWNLLASYFFLPSYNGSGKIEPLLGVGWTLIFEMAFYALFAAALAVRRDPLWVLAPLLCALSLLASRVPADGPSVTYYCSTVVLYFLGGMVIGRFGIERRSGWRLLVWLLAIAGVMAISHWHSDRLAVDGPTLRFVLVVAVMAPIALFGRVLNGRIPKPVLYLGDASYALYLFHPLVAPAVPAVLARLGFISAPTSVTLSLVVALCVAAGLYGFVERRTTKALNGRLLKRPASNLAPAGSTAAS